MEDKVDRSDLGEETGEKRFPMRRPWHAPQFMLTEIALTDTQGRVVADAQSASQQS